MKQRGTETYRLNEKARLRLLTLYQASQVAQQTFNQAVSVIVEQFGLDAGLNHKIDFEAGIITPAAAGKPELVQNDEEMA